MTPPPHPNIQNVAEKLIIFRKGGTPSGKIPPASPLMKKKPMV